MLKYDDFMKLALNEAKKCSRKKEIPVGAIIVVSAGIYCIKREALLEAK